jgi:hypothetical protein
VAVPISGLCLKPLISGAAGKAVTVIAVTVVVMHSILGVGLRVPLRLLLLCERRQRGNAYPVLGSRIAWLPCRHPLRLLRGYGPLLHKLLRLLVE